MFWGETREFRALFDNNWTCASEETRVTEQRTFIIDTPRKHFTVCITLSPLKQRNGPNNNKNPSST